MSKATKIITTGSALTLAGIAGLGLIAPTFAISDGDSNDLNSATGIVAGAEQVQVQTTSSLILTVGNSGLVQSVDALGNETALAGSYGTQPSSITIPATGVGTQFDGYSHVKVISNDASGYTVYVMMCTDGTGTPGAFSAVTGCDMSNGGQNLTATAANNGGTASATYIAPVTDGSATLTGASGANIGGYWGYRYSTTTSGGSDAAAPTGNFNAVPVFTSTTPYGTQLLTTSATGVGIVNLDYSVITNATLEGGKYYSNWVIYTAVAD
jgi:hypothetical protein